MMINIEINESINKPTYEAIFRKMSGFEINNRKKTCKKIRTQTYVPFQRKIRTIWHSRSK